MKEFVEYLKKIFTHNIPLKLVAVGLAFLMVILINALAFA